MKGTSDGNINKAPTPGPWISGFKCVMADFQKGCVCVYVSTVCEKSFAHKDLLVYKQYCQFAKISVLASLIFFSFYSQIYRVVP